MRAGGGVGEAEQLCLMNEQRVYYISEDSGTGKYSTERQKKTASKTNGTQIKKIQA